MLKGIKDETVFIINSKNPDRYEILKNHKVIAVDATGIAMDVLGRPITNTAMYGALVAVSGLVSLDAALDSIRHEMKSSLIDKNIEIVNRTYNECCKVELILENS
jgi:pyruvate ferredoxin oxidoreductase gamma subunit